MDVDCKPPPALVLPPLVFKEKGKFDSPNL